tara:strand:+ start:516 stop:695 length:180 start_codon:yes stop_codon:yes gene_type:complete
MTDIRTVQNKNGSLTVYVPAKYALRFEEIVHAGTVDLMESEMDDEEVEKWNNIYTYEYR